jgi:hypothetical protein
VTSFEKPSEFAVALRKAMTESQDIEVLFAVWEQECRDRAHPEPDPQTDHLRNPVSRRS